MTFLIFLSASNSPILPRLTTTLTMMMKSLLSPWHNTMLILMMKTTMFVTRTPMNCGLATVPPSISIDSSAGGSLSRLPPTLRDGLKDPSSWTHFTSRPLQDTFTVEAFTLPLPLRTIYRNRPSTNPAKLALCPHQVNAKDPERIPRRRSLRLYGTGTSVLANTAVERTDQRRFWPTTDLLSQFPIQTNLKRKYLD